MADLQSIGKEFSDELDRICVHWLTNGAIASGEDIVLNGRILWAMSAAYNHTGDIRYLAAAKKQYEWNAQFFSRDEKHTPEQKESSRSVYMRSFQMYGLAEYYEATENPDALDMAKSMYYTQQKYAADSTNGGYFDFFGGETKSLNAQIHSLECLTRLYMVWSEVKLKKDIESLIAKLLSDGLNSDKPFMNQKFSADWRQTDDTDSYGDDLECAWLFYECAGIVGFADIGSVTGCAERLIEDSLLGNGKVCD